MQRRVHRFFALALTLALALCAAIPASALLFGGEAAPQSGSVAAFSKNAPAGRTIAFSAADFVAEGELALDSILISSLPDLEAGVLTLGDSEVTLGTAVGVAALDGLRFQPLSQPGVSATCFTFTPVFADGSAGEDVTVGLYLLTAENGAPIAENLELNTYKNVPLTGRFAATDPEGDLLSFRIVDKPARGAVTLCEEEGSAEFVYTPYENKTGKDSFTYVAVDAVGNTSQPATVKIRIEKPKTKVTYADMDGVSAYNAAIRLAEEGVFVGEQMNGAYFFRPDEPVSRNEFVAMAMRTVGMEALDTITRTGFADDDAIPTWAKGYVASSLKAGMVQGSAGDGGRVEFRGSSVINRAEATVLLDRMLRTTEVTVPTFYADSENAPNWAYQAAVNLETAGVLQTNASGELALLDELTRADAAEMLCGALELLDHRGRGGLFG